MSRGSLRRMLAGAALVAALFSGHVARADSATAEHLFQEGLAAMKRQDYSEACKAFKGSFDAEPAPGTMLNLAICNEKQRKYASAWSNYIAAADLSEQKNNPERAQAARTEAQKIAAKRQMLVVRIKGNLPEGVEIKRNGGLFPSSALGGEVPVDWGQQNVVATAPGKKQIEAAIEIKDPDAPNAQKSYTLELGPFEDLPVAAASPGGGSDYRPPAGGETVNNSQRNVGFVVGGAGIIALLAAGALQGLALIVNADAKDIQKDLEAERELDAQSPKIPSLESSYNSKKDAAKNNQLAAIITGAGGVVMIGVGVTLVLTSTSKPKEASKNQKPWVLPMVGGGVTGVALGGSF